MKLGGRKESQEFELWVIFLELRVNTSDLKRNGQFFLNVTAYLKSLFKSIWNLTYQGPQLFIVSQFAAGICIWMVRQNAILLLKIFFLFFFLS